MTASFSPNIPLSVYVHIPWCVRKCPYCDFNSHAQKQGLPESRYIDALMADLEQKLPSVWGRRITSVFIGGGTPSLFSGEAMARLMREMRERLPITPDTEITMEANPGTFETAKFAAFREAGINRLSIGIQSFSNDKLRVLGRIHDANEAENAVKIAKQAGFENINLDLMFALPGQSLEQAMADLDKAISQETQHLSFYQLTLEPNTEFYVKPPSLPEDDAAWEIQHRGIEKLAQAGFGQYEVSAYAKPGCECRHNRNYWEFGDYLGLGAGAHGKVTSIATGEVERHWNYRQPQQFMDCALEGSGVSGQSVLEPGDLRFEFMLNALRLRHGFQTELYTERTGLEFSTIADSLKHTSERALVEVTEAQKVVPTERGFQYLNELVMEFLEDKHDAY